MISTLIMMGSRTNTIQMYEPRYSIIQTKFKLPFMISTGKRVGLVHFHSFSHAVGIPFLQGTGHTVGCNMMEFVLD